MAQRPWTWLVEDVRNGPPKLSPMRVGAIDRAANTMEFFIHHEDVRRATNDWEPRVLPAPLEAEMWAALRRTGRIMMRKAPATLTLVTPSGDEVRVSSNGPEVRVIGRPGELLLFAYGRQAHADVEVVGPDDAVAGVRSASFGI